MVEKVKDPVCGMEIRPEDAVATEHQKGRWFSFCSQECHEAFVSDPHRYVHAAAPGGDHGGHHHG
jgi:Cu+-exporting ATPase